MAIAVARVVEALEDLCPAALALEGDATGLQVGSTRGAVERVLCALDLTLAVAEEARDRGCGLIVSHHAVVFRPLPALRTDTSIGRILEALIKAGITAWVPHTALDVAPGGTNDELARLLLVEGARPLQTTVTRPDGSRLGIGRVGRLAAPARVGAFAEAARERLAAPWARLVAADADAPASTIAVLAGDGRRYVDAAAAAGADVLVTGDVDHHTALAALARGIALVDVGHWGSERHAARLYADGLRARLAGEAVEVLESAVDTNPFRAC